MRDKIKLVYIVGDGRSGTTLLDRLLGQVDGFLSAGELKLIWDWSFAQNQLCGCKLPFRECPFWQQVVSEAFGNLEAIDPESMRKLERSLVRYRYLPHLLTGGLGGRRRRDLAAYTETIARLYRAIHTVSGGNRIIDSSKNVLYSLALNRIADLDIHLVHLVRDSRAVAYSWQRKRRRPEIHWQEAYMDVYGYSTCARNYAFQNAMILLLRRCFRRYTRLRYEDVVARPRETLQSLCHDLGEANPSLDFLDGQKAHLQINHTVAGNPMRFQTGTIDITLDAEWQQCMSRRDKQLVSLLTFPLLLRYGYAGRRKAALPRKHEGNQWIGDETAAVGQGSRVGSTDKHLPAGPCVKDYSAAVNGR